MFHLQASSNTSQGDFDIPREADAARAIMAGRIDLLFRLGRNYLFLPFATLCVAASLREGRQATWLAVSPLLLQIGVMFATQRLTLAYERRRDTDNPILWARRYTVLSGVSGAIWGAGALIWFVPGSIPAESYLALAFLGITATEFIARSVYRPAYLTHATLSLVPLAVRLLMEDKPYTSMSSVLVLFFGGVLYSYCEQYSEFVGESIRLRWENTRLVANLSREKRDSEVARDVAEASTRAKSTFIANISHEIRTSLNALLGMAQLLESSELDRTQRGHVKVVLEAGRGLKALLDDVIALSRHDEPRELSDEDCDAAHAARTVGRLLQPRAWEKQIRLKINAPAGLPRVAADPRRVRQVLLKLADNAIKFTDRGSVEIRVECIVTDDGVQTLRFSVIDSGLGLPPEFAHQVFQPFSQADGSYAKRHEGAGLGLAVAKRTVETLGGEIGFESAPGEGAAFWFTVPAKGATPLERPVPTGIADVAPPPSGLAFLISLPDPKIATQISGFLEPFGNDLKFAQSASDAIALAGRETFDAIIAAASDADTLAAAPGVKVPVLAVLMGGMQRPAAAGEVLRWPAPVGALYTAVADLLGRAGDGARIVFESDKSAAIDAPAFAALEKSLGLTTLIEILQAYVTTAEELSSRLASASEDGNWDDATRIAQDIAGAAGGLGLAALTTAARGFTQKVREGSGKEGLRTAVDSIVSEHARVRKALANLYPDLAA